MVSALGTAAYFPLMCDILHHPITFGGIQDANEPLKNVEADTD
jgi:hypothetical protein